MAKKPKQRIDTSAERAPLDGSPFAGLGVLRSELPPGEAASSPAAQSKPAAPYAVGKTRKGGYALSIEKRRGGKCVTLLGNVSGDAAALLKTLKRHCGAGGAVREGTIEIQGDHRGKIRELLESGRA